MATGGEAVVKALVDCGVKTLFTVPGESFLPLLDALFDVKDAIQVVQTRHEEGAAFAAEAYAKATTNPGVVAVTRGVGSSHAAIAIHTAAQDATPLVVLVGQVPTSHKAREAFQELELEVAFAGFAKWSVEIPHAQRIPELMTQAVRVATSGRPGPVIVGLPEDVLYGEIQQLLPTPRVAINPPVTDGQSAKGAAQALQAAKRPAIIAGREVLAEGCTDQLVSFAERHELPVFTAFRRFDAFPNRHPNYAGNIALGTPKSALQGLYDADLVLFLGDRFDEITTHSYRMRLDSAELIHVATDASLIGTWGTRVTGVVSTVGGFLNAVNSTLGAVKAPYERKDWIARCHDAFENAAAPEPAFPEYFRGVNLSASMQSIERIAPSSTAIVTDAGNFSAWVSRYYRFSQPRTHFGPISGAMGYAMPGAIGVAFADPQRPVVAIAGDGGFMMTMSELAVAKAHALHIVVLVFVNNLLGTIRMHQERHFPNRPMATDLVNPSFSGIAQAFGIRSTSATTNAELDEALTQAFSERAPMLIEVFEGEERLAAWGTPVIPHDRQGGG